MLLVMVALGVLKGLDTAQQSSGREKARSTAAALTEQDQERLRSFRAVDLANYDETRTINVNNVDYTVQSQVDWVRDSTGGTQSCNNSATQADYMRITSTTTSNLVNTPIAPITQSSLVAPPVGAFGANQGTLGVQVNDRDGTGVEDVSVTITGPTTVTNPTNSAGCAIFAYVPVGAYTAKLTPTAGSTRAATRPPASAPPSATAPSTSRTSTTTRRPASTASSTPRPSAAPRCPPRPRSCRPPTPACRPGRSPRSPASACGIPTGGALGTISAHRPLPVRRRLQPLRRRLPGRRPDEERPPTTSRPSGANSVVDVDPGHGVAGDQGPDARRSTCASSTTAPRWPDLPARTRASSSPRRAPTAREKFTFAAPSTDANGWMLQPALPFGDYKVCAESRTPASPVVAAQEGRSPASTTSTTTA